MVEQDTCYARGVRHGPAIRRQAASLFDAGVPRAEVARQLGIARSTSSAWHRLWTQGALLEATRRGPPRRLDPQQLDDVGRALLEPPSAHGIGAPAWSLRAIALLIEQRTGVSYHHRHIARLVRQAGWLVPPFERYAGAARLARPIETPDVPINVLLPGPG